MSEQTALHLHRQLPCSLPRVFLTHTIVWGCTCWLTSTVCSVVKTRPGTQGTHQAPSAEVTAYLPWQFLNEFLDGSSTWTATASAHTMVEFVGMQGLHALGSACILTKRPPPQSPNHHRFALESGMETREVCEQMHAACPVPFTSTVQGCPPTPRHSPVIALLMSCQHAEEFPEAGGKWYRRFVCIFRAKASSWLPLAKLPECVQVLNRFSLSLQPPWEFDG